jgi:hypothetical protein
MGMPQVPLSLHQTVSIIEPLRGSSVHTRTSIKRFGGLCIKTSRKVWRLVRAQGHQWGQGGTITGKKTFGYLGVMEKRVIFASGIYIYK